MKSERTGWTSQTARSFEQTLRYYRELTTGALLRSIPQGGPPYLYKLVQKYPSRPSKGLRAALCLAMCEAFGGNCRQALNSAVATELLHNAFLIHDDVQDGSECRRGMPTLYRTHGVPIAVNVGNATNVLALQRLAENHEILGPQLTSMIFRETEHMMSRALEGQALELGWIRDNVCELEIQDYLRMCLNKTSWYSFIYPMRIGALIARAGHLGESEFCRFGWYFGAAFQIQDDILNLTGQYKQYGKEIGGDLWEGKRTLMLIHLLKHCSQAERKALQRFLSLARSQRSLVEVAEVMRLFERHRSIEFARRTARQLAGAALLEASSELSHVPNSTQKRFIIDMIFYSVLRSR